MSTAIKQHGSIPPDRSHKSGAQPMNAAILPLFADAPGIAALQDTSLSLAPQAGRPALGGATHDPNAALILMNAWFFVGERDGEVGIYRIEDNGTLTHLQRDDFQMLVGNIFVSDNEQSTKSARIDKFWLANSQRRACSKIVFDPSGACRADEYNQWRGYSKTPRKGYQNQRRLLRHIFRIICKRNKSKFKYLMRWLAWAVQNPHRHAEVVVVLMSNTEGSGKSTLGKVMLDIFGSMHGLLVDDKEQLLGQFNSHLETSCFVLGEEVLWAGDPRTADALKSRITASTIPIDEKYRHRRQVPNRLHVMLTTNHTWAVAAGVQARRYFVVEVSDEVAQDKSWFDPLYRDLEAGGTEEFLNLLLTLKLGNWHPREVPKTEELIEQQILSANSVEQWLLACADLETIVAGAGGHTPEKLDCEISTKALYDAYCEYAKRRSGTRVESLIVFGRLLSGMLEARRLPASSATGVSHSGNRGVRPPGYFVPDAATLRDAVHKHLKTGK